MIHAEASSHGPTKSIYVPVLLGVSLYREDLVTGDQGHNSPFFDASEPTKQPRTTHPTPNTAYARIP